MSAALSKLRVQFEDIIIHKSNPKEIIRIAFTVLNRRGIPFPNAVYETFNEPPGSEDEGDESFLLEHMIPEAGKCLVDIGASVGCWTAIIAKRGFEVYAYEPSPKAYRVLKERAGQFPKVHTFDYALGENDSIGRLGYSAFGLSGTMNEEVNIPGGKTINVTLRKLDSLAIPQVGVIKIDTEGYETPILKGAKETIKKYKPTLIIEVHQNTGQALKTYSEELERIKQILRELGYTWHVRCRPNGLHEHQPHVIAKYQKT